MITQGLDGLADRLKVYKEQGARFAKWREVYPIDVHNPKPLGVEANAEVLEHTILKPSMVTPGKEHATRSSPEEVAENTVKVLRRSVPAAVPSINFLSGGQSDEEATANLNAMNAMYPNQPWELSFSYGRALQQPALHTWQGKEANYKAAQNALYKRACLNGAARYGKYTVEAEY